MRNTYIPLISIGVPVHNEERFIAETLKCILSQDYPNVEIILSDNHSTDGTLDISRTILSPCKNAQVLFNAENEGATRNFQRVLDMSSGKYFMWASGHDLWAVNYLSRTVEALEKNPSAVLAFGTSQWIDEEGRELKKHFGYTDTRGMHPVARFLTVFYGNMNPVLGVFRRESLLSADPLRAVIGADLILLTQLSLMGDFIHVPETMWKRREFRHEQTHAEKVARYTSDGYSLAKKSIDKKLPLIRLPLYITRVIAKSRISCLEKIALMLSVIFSLPVRYISGKRIYRTNCETRS